MKRIVDEKMLRGEDCNGMYWLTGSQKFPMMKSVEDSLSGRVGIFDLSGFSTDEPEGRNVSVFSPIVNDLKARVTDSQPKNIHQILLLS